MKNIINLTIIIMFLFICSFFILCACAQQMKTNEPPGMQTLEQGKTTQEVGYDDGSFENSTSLWDEGAGSEIAAKFELDSYPARIQSVKFFIPKLGKYDRIFQVVIYDSNGLKGSPGNELLNDRIVTRATQGNEWVAVDLSKLGLAMQDHFFVSMRWLTAPGKYGKSAQFIACDTSNPKENTWVKRPSGGWFKIKDFGKSGDRTAMIRVVLFQAK